MNDANKKLEKTNEKKFVSLSDILRNDKSAAHQKSNSDLTAKHAQTLKSHRLAKTHEQKHVSASSFQLLNNSSGLKELKSVRELFEDLELDCDEQIKQLDILENKRKQNAKAQKKILDQITIELLNSHHNRQKQKYQVTSKSPRRSPPKRKKRSILVRKLKPKPKDYISVIYIQKKLYFFVSTRLKWWKSLIYLKNFKSKLRCIEQPQMFISKTSFKFLNFYFESTKNYYKNNSLAKFKYLNDNPTFNLPVIKMNNDSEDLKFSKFDSTSEYSSSSSSPLPTSSLIRRKSTRNELSPGDFNKRVYFFPTLFLFKN